MPNATKEPTIADFIARAKEAEDDARQKGDRAQEALNESNSAKQAAKDAWDVLYAELLRLKEANKDSEAFQNSKLGMMLRNVR